MEGTNEKGRNLFEQLMRVQWLMHRYHLHRHMDRGPMGDPHRGQGRVLSLLKLRPEISQRDLLYLLDMRPQSLGELLAKLEKAGYIERRQSETDRRTVAIKLTEAGAQAAEQSVGPEEADPFGCLSEEEQAALTGYLERIADALKQSLGDGEKPCFGSRDKARWHAGFKGNENWGGPHFSEAFGPGWGPGPEGECGWREGRHGCGRHEGGPDGWRGFGPDGPGRRHHGGPHGEWGPGCGPGPDGALWREDRRSERDSGQDGAPDAED